MTSTTRSILLLSLLALSMPVMAEKPDDAPKAVAEPIEVTLSHSFGQEAAQELQKLVDRFNQEHPKTPVTLVRQEPDAKPAVLNILRRTQVAEFVANKQSFKPLHRLMSDHNEAFDLALSPDLKAGVSDSKGRMVALPLAYSTPVMFYNKNAFRKAKLDPEKAPATWEEVQETIIKLGKAGFKCPYTTSWTTWIHVDNMGALAGSPVVNPKGELVFNSLMQVKHIAKLATWKKAGLFHVFGRRNEADQQFRDGNCVILTTDSWAHSEFGDAQGVDLGVAPLPHHGDGYEARQHTLADGPSLWVGAGYKAREYKTAAKFIAFLLRPAMQVELASVYGHLPLTEAARLAFKSKALRDRGQTLEVAYASMNGKGGSEPVRISAIDPVRIILEEELERVWDDKIPPKEALDNAVARGNAVLKAQPALRKTVPVE